MHATGIKGLKFRTKSILGIAATLCTFFKSTINCQCNYLLRMFKLTMSFFLYFSDLLCLKFPISPSFLIMKESCESFQNFQNLSSKKPSTPNNRLKSPKFRKRSTKQVKILPQKFTHICVVKTTESHENGET